MPHTDEVKAQALALYLEHDSSRLAADALGKLGIDVHPVTIQRWSAQADGHAAAMQRERRHTLAERWYGVANGFLDRVEEAATSLPLSQVTVPAAIATDKYAALTSEAPVPTQAQPFAIVVIQTPKDSATASAPHAGDTADAPIEGEYRAVDD